MTSVLMYKYECSIIIFLQNCIVHVRVLIFSIVVELRCINTLVFNYDMFLIITNIFFQLYRAYFFALDYMQGVTEATKCTSVTLAKMFQFS